MVRCICNMSCNCNRECIVSVTDGSHREKVKHFPNQLKYAAIHVENAEVFF